MAENGWDMSGSFGGGYLKTVRHPRGESIQSFGLLDVRVIFPAMTQLQDSFRARRKRQVLDLSRSSFVNDLGWLHDVLSLVDTELVVSSGTRNATTIAPIIARRRRRRK